MVHLYHGESDEISRGHILWDSSIVGSWMLIGFKWNLYCQSFNYKNRTSISHIQEIWVSKKFPTTKQTTYSWGEERVAVISGFTCVYQCPRPIHEQETAKDTVRNSHCIQNLWSLTVQLQEYLGATLHPNLSSARAWKWELLPISFSEIESKMTSMLQEGRYNRAITSCPCC